MALLLNINRAFHTRLQASPEQDAALRAAAEVYGRVLRTVHAAIVSGDTDPRTRLTAELGVQRCYIDSAMRMVKGLLEGGRRNCKRAAAQFEEHAAAAERKAKRQQQKAARARTVRKRHDHRMSAHHAKRRAQQCRDRARSATTRAARPASICYGSRRLFDAQHHLADRGFASHTEWLAAWRDARSSELFSTGDASARSGNRLIQLLPTAVEGVYTLRVRLPRPCESVHGQYVTIGNVSFSYGADVISAALDHKRSIAWRLKRDETSWRAICQIGEEHSETAVSPGIVGVDFNDGFLAVAELDGEGNPARRRLSRVEIPSYGGTSEQRRDAMAKAVLEVVRIAGLAGKPIAIEDLDFAKKKAELRELGCPRRARMLSGLAFSQFKHMLVTRAARNGIRVKIVNPKLTSFMGRVRYAQQLGTDVHHAAAVIIGRRALGCLERATPFAGRVVSVPGSYGHVAVQAPDRMPDRYVRSWWWKFYSEHRRAHVAHVEKRRQALRASRAPPAIVASLAAEHKYLGDLLSASTP
jgi:IS605 OrfB family transposase